MTWGMVGAAAITVVGGAIASNQANKGAQGAANAQERAQQLAIDEQRRQYDQTRSDLSPYMNFGGQALPGLTALNSGDYSGFLNSPDYLAASQQGIGQLDKSAAAKGSLFSGGHERDLSQFNQGLASQYLNQYRNSLFQQAGMGQNAAAGLGGLGANAANQIGGAYGSIGNAQAGYLQARGDNNAQLTAGIAGGLNGLLQNRIANGSAYAPSQPAYTGLGGQPTFGGTTAASPFTPQYAADYNGFTGWNS